MVVWVGVWGMPGLDGQKALYDIDRYVAKREAAKEWLQPNERSTLGVVQQDALQAAYQHLDAATFADFERRKQVELEYLHQVRGIRQAMPSAIFQEGYAGYGNSWTGSKIRLLYPQDRKRGGRESREPFLPINKIHETEHTGMQLVPLRINLNTDKYQLRDRLVWNVDDTTIPLELFVENLLEDYGMPFSLAAEILSSLQAQINNHLPHIYPRKKVESSSDANDDKNTTNDLNSADPKDRIKEEPHEPTNSDPFVHTGAGKTDHPSDAPPTTAEAGPIVEAGSSVEAVPTTETGSTTEAGPTTEDTSISKTTNVGVNASKEADPTAKATLPSTQPISEAGDTPVVDSGTTVPTSGPPPESIKPDPALENHQYDEDMRITIKIDITIGQHQLVDQFEWDINNPNNSPEWFATALVAELGLPSEFSTGVTHAIREQSQIYSRTLFNSGYQFDGKPPHVQELRDELAMPVDEHAFLRRPEALEQYTPALKDSKPHGIDSDPSELEQERREHRSRRRQGRSSRRHQHDVRAGPAVADPHLPNQRAIGPDVSTPVYSSLLPGGVDRNLSILHMVACHEDELYGGDRPELVYYFNRNRKRARVPTASLFDETLVENEGPKWLVKLKIPKRSSE